MERIGWENDRGAYFINKLNEKVEGLTDTVDSVSDSVDDITEDVGALTDTLDSVSDSVDEITGDVGDISALTTESKTSVVSAINEVNGKIRFLTPVTNSTVDVTVPNNYRGLVIAIGAVSARTGMWYVSCTGSGAVVATAIGTAGANVTMTAGTNKIVIGTNVAYSADFFCIDLLGGKLQVAS